MLPSDWPAARVKTNRRQLAQWLPSGPHQLSGSSWGQWRHQQVPGGRAEEWAELAGGGAEVVVVLVLQCADVSRATGGLVARVFNFFRSSSPAVQMAARSPTVATCCEPGERMLLFYLARPLASFGLEAQWRLARADRQLAG